MVAFESLKTKEKFSEAKAVAVQPRSQGSLLPALRRERSERGWSRSAASTRVVAASTVFGKSTPLSIVETDQMDSAVHSV